MNRFVVFSIGTVALVGCGTQTANGPTVGSESPALGEAPALGEPPAAEAVFQVTPELVLSPSTVAPGGSFTATLTGCLVGEDVTFTVEGRSVTAPCLPPA